MTEALQHIDEAVFRFINTGLANPVTDKLMPFITERNNWFIFYVLIWLYLFFKGGRKGKVAAVLIILLILITDRTCDAVLKPLFHRIRPCHVLDHVNLLVGCTDSFSFPSNHAVNNFAAATLFTYFYRNMKYFLYSGALVVALSRVFVGVHYPSDVIAGAALGTLLALLVIYFWKLLNKRIHFI